MSMLYYIKSVLKNVRGNMFIRRFKSNSMYSGLNDFYRDKKITDYRSARYIGELMYNCHLHSKNVNKVVKVGLTNEDKDYRIGYLMSSMMPDNFEDNIQYNNILTFKNKDELNKFSSNYEMLKSLVGEGFNTDKDKNIISQINSLKNKK